MKMRSRTTIGVTAAALAVAAGTGGALAAAGSGGSSNDGSPGLGLHVGAGPGEGPAEVAAYLGLTESELRAQLEAGKSLAQIASAQGKSVAGLEDVIVSDAKTHLDEAVTNGKLTAAQAEKMLAELKSHVDDMVNSTGGPHGPGVRIGIGPVFGDAAATYLGLTQDELRTQLEGGKTLAQVATAEGKPVAGLEAAILAGAKQDLDQAVAAGKLTAAQEQEMLSRLQEHVDDIVNNAGPFSRDKTGPVSVAA